MRVGVYIDAHKREVKMEVGGILAVPTEALLESTDGVKVQQHYKKKVER